MQLEGFSVGEEDCGMMGGNCGQRLFSTRPNRVSDCGNTSLHLLIFQRGVVWDGVNSCTGDLNANSPLVPDVNLAQCVISYRLGTWSTDIPSVAMH